MTFGKWLAAQTERTDAVGDLARDATSDPTLPESGVLEDYELHLGPGIAWLLQEAWTEFESSGASA